MPQQTQHHKQTANRQSAHHMPGASTHSVVAPRGWRDPRIHSAPYNQHSRQAPTNVMHVLLLVLMGVGSHHSKPGGTAIRAEQLNLPQSVVSHRPVHDSTMMKKHTLTPDTLRNTAPCGAPCFTCRVACTRMRHTDNTGKGAAPREPAQARTQRARTH